MDLRNDAKLLRKNMTTPERKLWNQLRARRLGAKFRRQAPIGTYIVDFISFDARLVIEVDGRQHLNCEADVDRDLWLESIGYRVRRFWNEDVSYRLDWVVAEIAEEVAKRPPRGRPCSAVSPSAADRPLVPLGRGT